jgi:5-methylcytosine-specific restriction enzyme A
MRVLIQGRRRTLAGLTAKPALKTSHRFYLTAAWRNLVDCEIRRRFGSPAFARCESVECPQLGRTGIGVFGDHIRELHDGSAPLDPRNLQFLCCSCRVLKTNQTRDERQNSVGLA